MDPDPAIFVIDLQDANKKLIYFLSFSAYFFLQVHLHHFSKMLSIFAWWQNEPDPDLYGTSD